MEKQLTKQPLTVLRMLRLPEVKKRVGLGRSAIYAKIKCGEFTSPVSVGPRAVAWISDEISSQIEACIAASRGHAALEA